MQLIQLRDVYRQGWTPDWNDGKKIKYIIYYSRNTVEKCACYKDSEILSFQTSEIRDKFLNNFRDLIEQAKELL